MGWGDLFEGLTNALGAYDTYSSGQQRKKHDKDTAASAMANAAQDEKRKADSLKRGVMEADRSAQRKRALVGKQRAIMGASGVAVGQGSFANVINDTLDAGQEDEQTTMQNALREAWGFQTSANNERARAKSATNAADAAGLSSWVGGLGSLAAGTYSMGKERRWWETPVAADQYQIPARSKVR